MKKFTPKQKRLLREKKQELQTELREMEARYLRYKERASDADSTLALLQRRINALKDKISLLDYLR